MEAFMTKEKPRQMIKLPGGGFFHDTITYIKLIIRLMADKRVHPLLKLLPIGSLLYIIWPLDIPGPIDDTAVLGLGMYMFVEFCPKDIVEEHLKELKQTIPGEWHDIPQKDEEPLEKPINKDNIIEAEYRDKDNTGS
jgi:uncharacterized membrane protein YkvA (DUF1232 family)